MHFPKALINRTRPLPILDVEITTTSYCGLDLSITNTELEGMDISNADTCQIYINSVLERQKAKVAFGGYLERRNLYGSSERFQGTEIRNIHMGVDFWCEAGTKVLVPLDGEVHSYANNDDFGNYGPTIILKHTIEDFTFYTLYGHLSLESLNGIHVGKEIGKGKELATLGVPEVNVGYAPHLHFQIVLDIGDFQGDYPGVCAEKDLEFFKRNCPDPNFLLGYGA